MSIDVKNYTTSVADRKSETVSKKEGISAFLNKDIKFGSKSLSLKKKEAFYTELATLLKAGLDLKTSLELIEDSLEKEKDKVLLSDIQESIIQGSTLSTAMQTSEKFSLYEVYSIRIAEESGQLTPVLDQLSEYFHKQIQYKRLLISALSYPVLVVFVAVVSLAFLLRFLVPLFGDLYSRLDQTLPGITTFIIQASELMQQYTSVSLFAVAIVIAFLYSQKEKEWFRLWSTKVMVRIPIFGILIKRLYLARFAHAMGFLLSAQVPVMRAIDLLEKMVGFYPIEKSLGTIKKEILKGKALHKSMDKYPIYPHRMIALIKVGEEANQLDTMFNKLAEQYNDDVEQQTKMLGSMIEPVLIVFLAIVVGVVLVAMYLPIFKLVTNVG